MKDAVLKIIAKSSWVVIKDQEDIKMIQVQKGADKINVYWSKMTVVTYYKGLSPKSFHSVDFDTLKEILGVKAGLWEKLSTFFKSL